MKLRTGVLLFPCLIGVAVHSQGAEPILPPGAKPMLLQETGAGEGPAWHPNLGLLTSGDGHIMRRDRDGKMSVFRKNAGSNGLMFDRQGRLVICESAQRRVTRLEADGTLKVLADRYEGKRFNTPNDLTIGFQGQNLLFRPAIRRP